MSEQLTSTEVKSETFYARSAGLTLWPKISQRVIQDGQSQVIDGSPICFMPVGRSGWGYYTTKDPEEIEYLRKRSETAKDVFDAATYNEMIKPPDVKIAEAQRTLESTNRLLAQLQEENRQLRAQAGEGRPSNRK